MEIPIKKVTVAQIIKLSAKRLVTKINGSDFIGTEYFLLREDFATKGFINRLNALQTETRQLKDGIFDYLADPDRYKCTDEDIVGFKLICNDTIVVLDTAVGSIGIDYNYYSYFKKLGVSLRFKSHLDPIVMLKNDEFVGILLPVKIKGVDC